VLFVVIYSSVFFMSELNVINASIILGYCDCN